MLRCGGIVTLKICVLGGMIGSLSLSSIITSNLYVPPDKDCGEIE